MAKKQLTCLTVAVILLAFACNAQQFQPSPKIQQEMMKNRASFDKETTPIGRAKALVKLGRTELQAALEAADTNNADSALQYVKDYDGQVQTAHAALLQMGVNPEKHSSGFRQLQISVRESTRTLRQIAGQIPFTQRQPFEDLQNDLDALDQKLILELFPRQPGHEAEKPKN